MNLKFLVFAIGAAYLMRQSGCPQSMAALGMFLFGLMVGLGLLRTPFVNKSFGVTGVFVGGCVYALDDTLGLSLLTTGLLIMAMNAHDGIKTNEKDELK